MRQLAKQIRWLTLVVTFTAVGVFAVQNAALVELRFLSWQFEVRRVFVIVISLIVGGLVGWLFGVTTKRRQS